MTDDAIDLNAYLRRIGHAGPVAPNLGTLEAVVLRHTATIAFENLDPLLGRPPKLDLGALQQKLVQGGRGGYCYEQNLLLRAALAAIGFRVTLHLGRVLWGSADDAIPQRSHALLRVDLADGPRIVDVGFGGQTLTGVLRLGTEDEQPTPHEPFRLVRAGDDFKLQARLWPDWRSLYRFDLQPQWPIDCEGPNWYVSTHPRSHFISGLSAARIADGRRYALRDADFAVHHLGGATERRRLADRAEMKAVLTETFGLTLPDDPGLDFALDRVLAATPP